METTFKIGDRVRLKAWVAPRRASALGRLFEQGWVGVVKTYLNEPSNAVIVQHSHNPEHPSGESAVYEQDLELMPERQVHVVKDGKVYERRNVEGVFCCKTCSFDNPDGFCAFPKALCEGGYYNFQEVKSGKLVA